MYIIDKNTDFYDYYSNIYGVDKKIIYDRRDSTILTNNFIFDSIIFDSHHYRWGKPFNFLILFEIGFKQYLFLYENIKIITVKDFCSMNNIEKVNKYDLRLVRIFSDNKHYFDKEISFLYNIYIKEEYKYSKQCKKDRYKIYDLISFNEIGYDNDYRLIENPIIKDSMFTAFFDPSTIWKELSMYCSSRYNDKTINIKNSNKEEIINHGFDVKTSFRHPIKI